MSVIYVLKHPRNPSVSKIGETGVGAHTRVSYQGIDWSVHKVFPVAADRRKGIEKFVHDKLVEKNVNIGGGAREIFNISAEEAATTVEALIRNYFSRLEAGFGDEDYWRYVATSEERQERKRKIREEALQDKEEKKKAKLRNKQLRFDTIDRDEYLKLFEDLDNHNNQKSFSITITVGGGLFFFPILWIILLVISDQIVDLGFRSDVDAAMPALLSATFCAFILSVWAHKSEGNYLRREIGRLREKHVVECAECGRSVWRKSHFKGAQSCPECKAPIA